MDRYKRTWADPSEKKHAKERMMRALPGFRNRNPTRDPWVRGGEPVGGSWGPGRRRNGPDRQRPPGRGWNTTARRAAAPKWVQTARTRWWGQPYGARECSTGAVWAGIRATSARAPLNAGRSCISVHIRSYQFILVYIWHIYAHTGGGGGGAAGPGLGDRRLPSPTPSSSA